MKVSCKVLAATALCFEGASAFVQKNSNFGVPKSRSSLQMVDNNVIMGAGIAIAGLTAGIGLVAFTETQGERSQKRGGLSDSMSTSLAGKLMEDVEVSSVGDIGSLTDQLEAALKATGGTKDEDLVMTEEQKRKIEEEADDGW